MFLRWLHRWVKDTIPANRPDRRTSRKTDSSPSHRRSSVQPMLEYLEDRRLLSANLYSVDLMNAGPIVEGQEFSRPVATIYSIANNTNNVPSKPTGVTIQWGDGQSSQATRIVQGTAYPTLFTIYGDHTYQFAGVPTPQITLLVNEGSQLDTVYLPTNTYGISDAPLDDNHASPVNATAGTAFTGTIASFRDENPFAKAGDYTVKINWGDGSGVDNTTGKVAASNTGTGNSYDVTGSHTYSRSGDFTIATTVTDGKGGYSQTFYTTANVTYTGVGLVIPRLVNTTEGQQFHGPVATFTALDPNAHADGFYALISWGDGAVTNGDIADNHDGTFNITGEHDYTDEGTYPVAITVTASAYGIPYVSGSVAHVTDAALTATNNNLNATEGKAYSGVVASFTDANHDADAGDFTAVITWGDGHVSTGTIAANGSRFDVSGTNTYAEEGSYHVTVQITDKGGNTATANSTLTVADAALTAAGVPTLTGKPNVALSNVTVATFTDASGAEDASHYTATINWGDGATGNGTLSATSIGFKVTGSHTYSGAEAYNISITIKDEGGSSITATTLADLRPPTPSGGGNSNSSNNSGSGTGNSGGSSNNNGSGNGTNAMDRILTEIEKLVAEIETEIQQMISAEMAVVNNLFHSTPKV